MLSLLLVNCLFLSAPDSASMSTKNMERQDSIATYKIMGEAFKMAKYNSILKQYSRTGSSEAISIASRRMIGADNTLVVVDTILPSGKMWVSKYYSDSARPGKVAKFYWMVNLMAFTEEEECHHFGIAFSKTGSKNIKSGGCQPIVPGTISETIAKINKLYQRSPEEISAWMESEFEMKRLSKDWPNLETSIDSLWRYFSN